jgi:hypothetical protein
VMSPTFLYFIDICRTTNKFVIRDMVTKIELYEIPLDLMDPSREKVSILMNRFDWIEDDVIRIINKEGIEKIIDLKQKFKEVEYNVIPLFPQQELIDPQAHFYKNRKSLNV